jgi:hypothetical protein
MIRRDAARCGFDRSGIVEFPLEPACVVTFWEENLPKTYPELPVVGHEN